MGSLLILRCLKSSLKMALRKRSWKTSKTPRKRPFKYQRFKKQYSKTKPVYKQPSSSTSPSIKKTFLLRQIWGFSQNSSQLFFSMLTKKSLVGAVKMLMVVYRLFVVHVWRPGMSSLTYKKNVKSVSKRSKLTLGNVMNAWQVMSLKFRWIDLKQWRNLSLMILER